MLRSVAAQAQTLWDEALPMEVRELPADLPAVDRLLSRPALLAPLVAHWQREARLSGASPPIMAGRRSRPTYVRLMVLNRRGWGYER